MTAPLSSYDDYKTDWFYEGEYMPQRPVAKVTLGINYCELCHREIEQSDLCLRCGPLVDPEVEGW